MAPSLDDYTIGWICALPTEHVAAKMMLDEEHEVPRAVLLNDATQYTLGTIEKHNIVIATPPVGRYESASVARVAVNILETFPSLRIALLLGIGGGVPSQQHDVRLGDVVVGVHEHSYGACQYDLQRSIQEQCLRPNRSNRGPPSAVIDALMSIRTQHGTYRNQLENVMAEALTRHPKLRKRYKRPDLAIDRLFKSHITHDSSGCAASCAKEESNLVKRPVRTETEGNLAVHYGRIASGYLPIKDALVRDMLAARENILCFETEACGLTYDFPCLLIRGICSYTDSHRNKEWHRHAALAAAAFAKHLILHLSPEKVEKEIKIKESLGMYRQFSKSYKPTNFMLYSSHEYSDG